MKYIQSFSDRSKPGLVENPTNGERWVWYAQDGKARLWSGKEVLAVNRDGESWSTALKENVTELSGQEAMVALQGLNAVKFNYKADSQKEQRIGFIAEEVPDLVANSERDRLSPMDLIAVLTKAMQEQQRTISALAAEMNTLKQQKGGQ